MSVSDMNRALLSTFNSTSGESKLFMTHQTTAGVDSFALRLTPRGASRRGRGTSGSRQRATGVDERVHEHLLLRDTLSQGGTNTRIATPNSV